MATSHRGNPPEPPTVAFFLAFLGGVLAVVEGLVLLGGGPPPGAVVGVPSYGELPSLGGIETAIGVAIVATGLSLLENPRQRVTVGVVLIALGGLSVIGGGGFLAGAALSLVSGVLAAVRSPRAAGPVR
jgi:hypothetical protein